MRELMEVRLPDGEVVWTLVEADGPVDVGKPEAIEKIQGWTEALHGVASNVISGLGRLKPDKTTVEFGIEIAAGRSGVVAALVGAEGSASVKVTLTWNGGPPQKPADDEPEH